jgi:hypothetical protein
MRRGGCVILQVSELLEGDRFPDLTAAALGTWVRLKAMIEITGEPVGARQIERLCRDESVGRALDELEAAGLLSEADGRYAAIGMPEPPSKPSDRPEATRERQEASRLGISVAELRANRNPSPAPLPRSDQLSSVQESRGHALSRVTRRDTRENEAAGAPGPHQAEINGVLVRWTNV